MTVDYAHTKHAEQNRDAKAAALAAAARRLRVDSAGLDIGANHRDEVWRAAGCKRKPSEDTWFATAQLLRASEPDAATATSGPPPALPCVYHPDRPGRFYLRGWRCADCAPRQAPVPLAGTTLDDLLAARPAVAAIELDTRIQAAKARSETADDRARIASQAHRQFRRAAATA